MRPTRGSSVPSRDSPHIWSCCRWGLPCRRCHHRRGALLPHHFTLTLRLALLAQDGPALSEQSESKGGFFLLHFPSDHSALALPSTVPCAVRTFLTRRQAPSATAASAATDGLYHE